MNFKALEGARMVHFSQADNTLHVWFGGNSVAVFDGDLQMQINQTYKKPHYVYEQNILKFMADPNKKKWFEEEEEEDETVTDLGGEDFEDDDDSQWEDDDQ